MSKFSKILNSLYEWVHRVFLLDDSNKIGFISKEYLSRMFNSTLYFAGSHRGPAFRLSWTHLVLCVLMPAQNNGNTKYLLVLNFAQITASTPKAGSQLIWLYSQVQTAGSQLLSLYSQHQQLVIYSHFTARYQQLALNSFHYIAKCQQPVLNSSLYHIISKNRISPANART